MSAFSSISLMDREHLSAAFHLCAPDLSRYPPATFPRRLACTVYISQLPDPASSQQGALTKRECLPIGSGSLRWVGACLKVTFPEGHSLPRFRVITAPLMLLPLPEETVPLLIISPSSYFECVISLLVWSRLNTPSLIQSLFLHVSLARPMLVAEDTEVKLNGSPGTVKLYFGFTLWLTQKIIF